MSGEHVHSEMCIRWDQSGYVCKQLEEEDNQVLVDRRVLEKAIHDYEMEWGHSPRDDAWPNILRLLLGMPSGAALNRASPATPGNSGDDGREGTSK